MGPVFFGGQNSRLFQIASHVSQTLREALLAHEVRDKLGATVRVRIGAPLGRRRRRAAGRMPPQAA